MAAGNGLTAALDTATMKLLLGVASPGYSSPTTNGLYISLWTTQFTTSKAGATEWTTTSDTAPYARVNVTTTGWTIAAFVTGTGVVASNTNQLAFTAVAGNAQTLFSVGLNDALTAGNVVWMADLASSSSVAIGIIVQFNASTDIQLTLN
jgi:hypothetical protein